MLRLKELREQRRLNQEGLAMELNVSQSTISAYEIGERTPDLETLISIANFFSVSLDYITGLSDVKQQIRKSDLTSDELEYLYKYKQLNDIDKEKVKAYISDYKVGHKYNGGIVVQFFINRFTNRELLILKGLRATGIFFET